MKHNLDDGLDIILCQYQETLSFIRNFDTLIWQTPAITMAVNTFLSIAYFSEYATNRSRIIILFAAFMFTCVALFALQKHRFFQEARGDDFRSIQGILIDRYNIREIRLRAKEILKEENKGDYPEIDRRPMMSYSAFDVYSWLLKGTMVFIIILIIFHFFEISNIRWIALILNPLKIFWTIVSFIIALTMLFVGILLIWIKW